MVHPHAQVRRWGWRERDVLHPPEVSGCPVFQVRNIANQQCPPAFPRRRDFSKTGFQSGAGFAGKQRKEQRFALPPAAHTPCWGQKRPSDAPSSAVR